VPPTQPPAGSTKPYRDATGRTLADYPHPSVAVDTAVLTLAPRTRHTRGAPPHQLSVLLVRLPEALDGIAWALPGTFLHEGEQLADAVARSLAQKAGVIGGNPAQLKVFDEPGRDPRGWVLSVAHLAVIPHGALVEVLTADPERVQLALVSRPKQLTLDHSTIVGEAKKELRRRYADRPDPERLLGPRFTMRELLDVHQAIAGPTLQKDTFRRTMEPHLRGTGRLSAGSVGRPSQLFLRAR
jgi:8-oxo-dGTP diphosphatase